MECEVPECTYKAASTFILKQHFQDVHKPRNFKCPFPNCTIEKQKMSHLERHLAVHGPVERIRCTIEGCGFLAKNAVHLRQHVWSHSKRIYCRFPNCSYYTLVSETMRRHEQLHEEEKKEFQCMFCPRSFAKRAQLSAHVFYHTKEKPFMCSQCKRSWKRKDTLESHICAHSSEGREQVGTNDDDDNDDSDIEILQLDKEDNAVRSEST